MRRIRVALVSAVVIVGAGVFGTRSAEAITSTTISTCGYTIVVPGTYVLGANLDCSGGGTDGIDIETGNVTLNLSGFSITGAGGSDSRFGVYIWGDGPTLHRVIVENGTINDFEFDVYASGVSTFTASWLTLTLDGVSAWRGVQTTDVARALISHVSVKNAFVGFDNFNDAQVQIASSSATFGEYGYYGDNNTLDIYNDDFASSNQAAGFEDDESSGTRFNNSESLDNGGDGFDAYCNTSGSVTFASDQATGNLADGFDLYLCFAFDALSKHTTLSANTAESNGEDGIYDDNSILASYTNNVVKYNDAFGIFISVPEKDTLTGNKAWYNQETGIYLQGNASYYNVVEGSNNKAAHNGTYGFAADYPVPGTGNVATDNTPANCLNWVCT